MYPELLTEVLVVAVITLAGSILIGRLATLPVSYWRQ